MPLSRRIIVQDEGVQQGAASTINFVGSSVVASVAGGIATVTVSAGAGATTVGQALVDFGAFPGASDANVAVAAAGISAGSIITVLLAAVATVDHSADEHIVETINVFPGAPSAGVGFTIYATYNGPQITVDQHFRRNRPNSYAGNGLLYGKWTVNWSYT